MNKYDCELNLSERNSLSVLVQHVKPNSLVLEFGPANGRMTRYMKEQLNCQVYAVESDKDAAEDAAKFTEKIVIASIENYSWRDEFKGMLFDTIIFADVLEHLYAPQDVLESVGDFLKPDGSVLISIPNIAHNSIIINLLKNQFDYSPTGLLDDTHIRFFTKNTFDALIEKAGFFRAFETAIFISPENTELLNSYNDLPHPISDFLRHNYYGEVYQFIYEIKKNKVETIGDFSDDHKPYANHFIQLFIEDDNGLSEENSIKLPVEQGDMVQIFAFDLKKYSTIKSLRLDPLDDSCVVCIESLQFIKANGCEVDAYTGLTSNAILNLANYYFFNTTDSNCYFSSLELTGVEKLYVRIRYTRTGRDALEISNKRIQEELAHNKAELEERQTELAHNKAELFSMQISLSWKITQPLRMISDMIQKYRLFFYSDIQHIEKSGLFDKHYYLTVNSDVQLANTEPLEHFVHYGWREGRNPSPTFNVQYYLTTHQDVALFKINPLVHYIKYGKKEGRSIYANGSQPHTTSKFWNLILLGKYAVKNPQLISRTILEVKHHGIKKTITKIKNKSYKNIELIVVNDSDKNLDWVKELDIGGISSLKLLNNDKEHGRCIAANIGLDNATGKYIMFLDDDDWVEAWHIDKLFKTIVANTDAVLAYTGALLVDENNNELWRFEFLPDKRQILAGNFMPIHSVLFCADVRNRGCRFDESLDIYEDWDFWIQLSRFGEFAYTPGISAYYVLANSGNSNAYVKHKAEATTRQLLKKWQSLWSEDDLVFLSQETIKAREIGNLRKKHTELERNNSELERKIHLMETSRSWKITKPLRYLRRFYENKTQRLLASLQKEGVIKTAKKIVLKLVVIETVHKEQLITSVFHTLKYAVTHPRLIQKFINEIRMYGIVHALNRAQSKIRGSGGLMNMQSYHYHQPVLESVIVSQMQSFTYKPLLSIIMPVYNVDPKWLHLAVESIKSQWYDNWELCIADDCSTSEATLSYLKTLDHPQIKITYLEKNLNISGASNEALSMAIGEYVALMDNDDEITPNALYEVVKAINETGAEFIYSDEDKLEMNGGFSEPHLKPDFAPDMFLSQNYISHLGVIKKSLINAVDGFTIGLEGSQDYDLYLKVFEHTNKIYHIQKVLYHWRKIPGSTAAEFSDKSYAQDAGVKAIKNAIKRRQIKAKVLNGKYPGTYRVQYDIIGNPLVSIIIPFKDKPELLKICIESIVFKSTYENFEIIGISNNSSEQATFDEMKRLEKFDKRIKFYEYNVPFNYSQINNYAVEKYANGEHIILLNNDIEIISPAWIESMLEHSQRDEIGCVGAKLYYPNDTIQHAGVTIGVLNLAGHNFRYLKRDVPAYFGRESVIYNVSAVTAACLMVKAKIFQELQGLNEENLKIAFNDVDFCLRVQEKGYRNIFTPYCEAYHHESISRGAEDNAEKLARFNSEIEYLQERHKEILKNGDPYYNPNLTLDREDFSLREPLKTPPLVIAGLTRNLPF